MEHNKGYSYDFQGDAQKHDAQIFESNTSNPTQLALFLKFDNINQLSSSQPIKIQYIHRP